MTHRRLLLLLATAHLAVGCSNVAKVVDPAVDDLAEVQAQAGDLAAIASREVTCRPAQDGCAQLRERKGDACLRLAQEAVAAANAAAAAPRAVCAAAEYRVLLDAGVGDAASLGPRELEALRLQRESATTTTAADRANDVLLRNAQADAAPGQAAGPYYAANALAWSVAVDPPAEPCATLARARGLAETAAATARAGDPIDLRAPAAAQVQRLAGMAADAGCAA